MTTSQPRDYDAVLGGTPSGKLTSVSVNSDGRVLMFPFRAITSTFWSQKERLKQASQCLNFSEYLWEFAVYAEQYILAFRVTQQAIASLYVGQGLEEDAQAAISYHLRDVSPAQLEELSGFIKFAHLRELPFSWEYERELAHLILRDRIQLAKDTLGLSWSQLALLLATSKSKLEKLVYRTAYLRLHEVKQVSYGLTQLEEQNSLLGYKQSFWLHPLLSERQEWAVFLKALEGGSEVSL